MSSSESETCSDTSLNTKYSLLDKVRDPNNEDAWREFIGYYEFYIYNILRRMGLNPSEADEVRQEIIVKLWKRLPEFAYNKDRGKFRFWLSTVIRNDARKFYRQQKLKQNYADSKRQEQEHDPTSNSDNSDVDKLISDEWEKYISNLAWENIKTRFNNKNQKAFLMFADGRSKSDIAEACGLSPGSVNVYIKRIRDQLIEEVERLNDELL